MTMPSYSKASTQFDVIKSIQLNKEMFSSFNLSVEKGRIFKNEDYFFTPNKKIPIILGNDFASITFDYIDTVLEGEVVEYLLSNTIIPVQNSVNFNIDRYIVLPEFSMDYIPTEPNELLFQQRHYLSLINGQIFTEKDQLDVSKEITSISENTDFYEVIVIGANEVGLNIMFDMLEYNKSLLVSLSVFLFAFAILSISISLVMKWNINVKRYAIHLVSGATISQIFSYSFFEVFLTVLFSLLLVFLLSSSIGILLLLSHND